MKTNKLVVQIDKPVPEVFAFTTTPPNSKYWINSVIDEETNEFPIRSGTIYKLKNKNGRYSKIVVVSIKKNEFVEWISDDKSYHCKYTFKPIDNNSTELEYYEWTDKENIDNPFTQKTLEILKSVLENPKQKKFSI